MNIIIQLIILSCNLGLVGYGLFKTLLVRIELNHLGLPEHIFKGRFITKNIVLDGDKKIFNYTLPPPFFEGWHFKNPLLRIHSYDQGTADLVLDEVEFQTKGGSISVSGVVIFRKSSRALFRAMETKETMPAALKAEVHSILTKEFVSRDINTAILEIGNISDNLLEILMQFPTENEDQYLVNGDALRRMEILCGIEVVSSTLERPEPSAAIKEERDNIATENYQAIAKTIERKQLLLDRIMHETFGTNPDLAANLAHLNQVGELPQNISYKSFHTDGGKQSKDLAKQITLLEALHDSSDTSPEQQGQLAEMLTLIKAMK
jgi:hypothetical protein